VLSIITPGSAAKPRAPRGSSAATVSPVVPSPSALSGDVEIGRAVGPHLDAGHQIERRRRGQRRARERVQDHDALRRGRVGRRQRERIAARGQQGGDEGDGAEERLWDAHGMGEE